MQQLSYQRLLEITGKMPGEEQEYVLRFLTANDRKTRAKVAELEAEKIDYERDASILNMSQKEIKELKKTKESLSEKLVKTTKAFDSLAAVGVGTP